MEISRQRTIKATPEAIWQAIAPVEALPHWLSGVQSATHLGGPAQGVGRPGLQGRQMTVVAATLQLAEEITCEHLGAASRRRADDPEHAHHRPSMDHGRNAAG